MKCSMLRLPIKVTSHVVRFMEVKNKTSFYTSLLVTLRVPLSNVPEYAAKPFGLTQPPRNRLPALYLPRVWRHVKQRRGFSHSTRAILLSIATSLRMIVTSLILSTLKRNWFWFVSVNLYRVHAWAGRSALDSGLQSAQRRKV